MNPFVSFMASTVGRIVRIVAGIVLIAWGWFGLSGVTGIVVAVIGLVLTVLSSVWCLGCLSLTSYMRAHESEFKELAETLTRSEEKIVAELAAVQGRSADIGGYYLPDPRKCEAVMRPSSTFNAALAQMGGR